MATLSIVLKTTHKLANEEFAVALRVTHDRQSKYFAISQLVTNQSLKFRCTKSQWKPAEAEDNGLGRFRKSYDHYKECNSILDTILSKGLKILKAYESDSSEFTLMRFELDFLQKPELINKQKSTLLLVDYYESHIKTLENQQRIGLAGLYKENQITPPNTLGI